MNGLALNLLAKSTALLMILWAAHAILGRRRALARSSLWNAGLLGLFVLPAGLLVLPDWSVGPVVPRAGARAPFDEVIAPRSVEIAAGVPRITTEPAINAPQPGEAPRGQRVVMPSISTLVVVVYAIMTGLLLLGVVGSCRDVGRLRDASTPVDLANWLATRDRWTSKLGVRRAIELCESDQVSVPVVVGWLRPAILLPRSILESARPEEIDAILSHELAHVRRGDYAWNLVMRIVRAVYWPHPLAWPLGRTIAAVREQVCDDFCVRALGGAESYRSVLIDVAAGLIGRTEPEPFLAMARASGLRRRLEWIDRTSGTDRCVAPIPTRAVAFVAVLGIVGPTAMLDPAPRSAAGKAPHLPVAQGLADEPGACTVEGLILDPDGNPVADAIVVASDGLDKPRIEHRVFRTNEEGRFTWKVAPMPRTICFVAYKEGFGPSVYDHYLKDAGPTHAVEQKLRRSSPYHAILKDESGQPIAGASVRAEILAFGRQKETTVGGQPGTTVQIGYLRLHWDVLRGSPLESLIVAKTDERGAFTIPTLVQDSWPKLIVTTADGRNLNVKPTEDVTGSLGRSMAQEGFLPPSPNEPAILSSYSAARVIGRVVTKLSGVSVADRMVLFQESHRKMVAGRQANMTRFNISTDADGRFAIENLDEGMINLFVLGTGENESWTYRAAADVLLRNGETTEVTIELIRGVEVEGKVVVRGTDRPVAGLEIGTYGPFRPRSGAMTTGAKTDNEGRYHYRLPTGETYFYAMGLVDGVIRMPGEGSSRTVTIPEGVASFQVPPIEVEAAVTLHGRVVDVDGKPVPLATIVGVVVDRRFYMEGINPAGIADEQGRFRLAGQNHAAPPGKPAKLLIRLEKDRDIEVEVTPAADGEVTARLPVAIPER